MNPGQQLHRSLTFWAGLLLIAFTCWAWRDSHNRVSTAFGGDIMVATGTNGLHIARSTGSGPEWGSYRTRIQRSAANLKWQSDYFPPPILVLQQPHQKAVTLDPMDLKTTLQARANHYGPGSWTLFLPFWLILLTLTIIWSALLISRARRHRRTKLLQTS